MSSPSKETQRPHARRIRAILLIGFVAASVAWSASRFDFMRTLERQSQDMRFRSLATTSVATDKIVVVDIDERSIESLEPDFGRWPWPRDAHAAVVQYLSQAGARVIAFDVLFSERTTRREIDREAWQGLMADAHRMEADPDRDLASNLSRKIAALDPSSGDDALSAAAAASGKVLFAMIFREDDPLALSDSSLAALRAATLSIPPADAVAGGALSAKAIYPAMILPLANLCAASAGLGHTNLHPDPDGPARMTFPILGSGATLLPSLPVATAALYLGAPISSLSIEPGTLKIGDRSVPLDDDGRMDILYQGNATNDSIGLYRHVSYADVLLSYLVQNADRPPPAPPEIFRDKVVLIGTTAAGLFDLRATPFSAVTPGVEIHCHVIDNIIAGRFLVRPPAWYQPLAILILSLAVAVLGGSLRPLTGLFSSLALTTAYGITAALLFRSAHISLELAAPILAAGFSYVAIALYRYQTELKAKHQIRGMMGKYVPAAVLEEILSNPEKLKLGGERRTVSILFSDVAGFTTLSDHLPPEAVALLLNEYLTKMTECVFAQTGTLDKFIGDAIMAEFGAPVEQSDHAARACRSALAMRAALGELHVKWKSEGRPLLECRIGIGSGEAIIGNMGSEQLFDYTAIGSIVNASARLEPLCKDFGTACLVSESTWQGALRDDPDLVFRKVALVRIKGMERPQNVYELLGYRVTMDEGYETVLQIFAAALGEYQASNFKNALDGFAAVLRWKSGDGPALTYHALCETYLQNPPEGEWAGVYEQKSK